MKIKYLISYLLILLYIISCDQAEKKESAEEAGAPNIIVLITDDQRWDALGYAGNKIIKTPNMDALAADGVYFKNAFVTTAICMTSRATVLSGQYARRHGINDFRTPFSESAMNNTYPVVLRDNGYYTGFIGKYGVGAEREEDLPKDKFDVWNGFIKQGHYVHQDEQGNYKHLTSIMGDQAVNFIGNAPSDKPFCLSVSFKAPHVQDEDPKQFLFDSAYIDLHKDDSIPLPLTADDEYFFKYPDFFTKDNEARRRWDMRFSTPEKYQASVKGYFRLIHGVDVAIGRIRKKLEEKGLDKNTVIILMGDNGFFLAEHGMAGKWYGLEESIRVPMFYLDPRQPESRRKKTVEEIALNIDLAPTILSFANVKAPEVMQGEVLTVFEEGTPETWRKDFFYEHLFEHDRVPPSEGVVSLDYKYLRYVDQNPVFEEFYDLKNDKHETMNLILNPEYSDKVNEYKARWEELRKQAE